MTKKSEQDEARKDAIKSLKKLLKPGATVYTILRHCSASGMSRVVDLIITYPDYETIYPLKDASEAKYPNERDYAAKPKRKLRGHAIRSIGYTASIAMGDKWDSDRQGIKIGGAGMDMGFALVYALGSTLWPKGTPKPHGNRNGEPDSAGGYALNHRWL